MTIKVLSLFDGISGARQAIKELNIDCEYFASEIDKWAIQVAKANYPDIKHIGDVKGVQLEDDYIFYNQNNKPMENGGSFKRDIDLLIGGSPCQDLSIANKERKGLQGDRSGLFYEYLRILNEVKPKYFVLENVASMSKAAKATITEELFGIEPVMINSALVTAQQRKRLYWVGKLVGGKYEQVKIEQPDDQEIYLKDIIEKGVVDRDKSYCIDANYFKGGNLKSYFEKCRRQLVFACAQRGRNIIEGKRKDIKGAKTEQRLETSYSEKSNCLTKVQKDSLLLEDMVVRKLTPTECCRLQGFPDVEKILTFDFSCYILDKLSIFINECQNYPDYLNKNVIVGMKNHKSPKLVLNAQKDRLSNDVKYAQNLSSLKYQKNNKLVLRNVHINLGESTLLNLNQEKLISNVNNVKKIKKLALQILTENFAHLLVGQNTTRNKIIKIGKEDFLVSTRNLLTLLNGKDYVTKSGEEMTLLAKYVMKNMNPKYIKNFIVIISEALSNSKNYEQKLVIFLYYVLAVITLFTQEKIQIKSLLEIRATNNYVSMVSKTQGYKALGNGFTVPVIKHILKNILI
mgnify:CR=1 FL=1|tara:strand:+ start:16013 stop:17728 length:1716 start_codon:yes stop_codon:yes gene_type:complete